MLSFEGLKGSRFRRPALTNKILLGRSVPHCWHLSKSHRNFFRRGWIVMNAGVGEKKPVPVALMSLPPTSYPSLWWGRQAPARGSSRKYTLPNTSQKEKHRGYDFFFKNTWYNCWLHRNQLASAKSQNLHHRVYNLHGVFEKKSLKSTFFWVRPSCTYWYLFMSTKKAQNLKTL